MRYLHFQYQDIVAYHQEAEPLFVHKRICGFVYSEKLLTYWRRKYSNGLVGRSCVYLYKSPCGGSGYEGKNMLDSFASSGCHSSRRFTPFTATVLGQPLVFKTTAGGLPILR